MKDPIALEALLDVERQKVNQLQGEVEFLKEQLEHYKMLVGLLEREVYRYEANEECE